MEGKGTTSRGKLAGKAPLTERMQGWAARKADTGVEWATVDDAALRAALHCCLQADVAVMFAPASGGLGVMVKVYEGGAATQRYCMSSYDLNEALRGLVDGWGSSSEDIYQVIKRRTVESMPAD